MKWRRSSGEIINATLLEIFLSFIFVVLTVAWFRAAENEALIANNKVLEAEKQRAEQERDRNEGARSRAEAERDSFADLYHSQFPPFCRSEYAFSVRLTNAAVWQVEVHVAEHGFSLGQRLNVSASDFRSALARFRDRGLTSQCRYRVLLYDTPVLSKEEYNRARRIVQADYYVAER